MNSASKQSIVTLCGDPGGAAALAPVLRRLQDDGQHTVHFLAYRQAVTTLERAGVVAETIDEATDVRAAAELLRDRNASLLLTATSVNGVDLEKKFIEAARELRLPSLAVLDYWANYRRRFANDGDELIYVPDRIAVMDARARTEMTAAGFDSETIVITGQPAFDALADYRTQWNSGDGQAIRASLGVAPNAAMILFTSQPMVDFYGTDTAAPNHPGFTEHTVIPMLIQALESIHRRAGKEIALVLRPHPRERIADLQGYKSDDIRIIVDDQQVGRAMTMTADLVIGMNSMILVEAVYLGRPVLSLQPGLRNPDTLPTNAAGLSRLVTQEAEVEPAVEQALADRHTMGLTAGKSDLLPAPDATGRVLSLIEFMLNFDSGRERT